MKRFIKLVALLLALIFTLSSCFPGLEVDDEDDEAPAGNNQGAYEEEPLEPYEVINGNVPYFTADEITSVAYEYYSPLDALGRCGVVHASIGKKTMPPKGDKRGDISSVYPTGWVQEKYDTDLVEGGYLYNRSHLIGWQLTDEDDNERNLITGTRYFNVEGMLPFENMVADYIDETGNHVMYRVTPDFKGANLVASGVLMEAISVEDNGEGISFCVYVFNYQPGIVINYQTGANYLGETQKPSTNGPESDTGTDSGTNGNNQGPQDPEVLNYILNTNSMKFHTPTCSYASKISETNKKAYRGTRNDLIDDGYTPCSTCKP